MDCAEMLGFKIGNCSKFLRHEHMFKNHFTKCVDQLVNTQLQKASQSSYSRPGSQMIGDAILALLPILFLFLHL